MTTTNEIATEPAPQAAAAPKSAPIEFADGPLRQPLAKLTKVSIVIPRLQTSRRRCRWLIGLVVKGAPCRKGIVREIICVNDCSKDGTARKLDELPALYPRY